MKVTKQQGKKEIVITAVYLYETDTVFRSLVDEWVTGRRCPYPLVDRCLDFDLHHAAGCARWAALAEDLPVRHSRERVSGPYPDSDESGWWYWFQPMEREFSYDLPSTFPESNCLHTETPREVILWLLDNWKEPS